MKRRLIAIFTLVIAWAVSAQATIYLVAAGVSDYPGTVNDLRLPAKDARSIHDLYKINTNAVSSLLTNSQATRANILNSLVSTFSRAGRNDIVVFFFSGHGYKGGFYAYDGQLPYSEVRKAMASSKAGSKMIFADACFSGKIREKKTGSGSGASESAGARSADVMLFLSSRDNEKSYERPTMQNGMFTTYLIKGLRGNADANRDRTISARELFNFVSKNVSKISGGKQHPVMWGKFSDNMPVMQW